ncbi:MAG: hypothetical protein DMF88_21375 [Acidobacteria bacterium]|nr:MAG: hypothetical protein DMF88_21375 [Acidobacteriota bacterium]
MLCLRDVIHLKIDLLRRLSRTSSEEWPVHIDHFIEQVETSPFRDEQALSVLLVDLAESIRVLLNANDTADTDDSSRSSSASTAAPRKTGVLMDFRATIHDLVAEAGPPRHAASPLVARMVGLIEEHYAEPLTLDVLAARLGRSKRYLAMLFQHQTGQTVHDFLTRVRVRHAAALIRAGEKIEAVSLLVGYRSKKNFYRHFKEQFGVTPIVYRTKVLGLSPPR